MDGYVPTDHDRARLLHECEVMERNQPSSLADKVPKKAAKKKQKKSKDSDKKPNGRKYCSEHGWGTHGLSECWTLHPELKPEKFKTSGEKKSKAKGNKETHALVQQMVQEQLKETLATLKPTKPKKKKRKQSVLFAESDSNESANAMETVTPEASDTKRTADKIQKFVSETISIDD